MRHQNRVLKKMAIEATPPMMGAGKKFSMVSCSVVDFSSDSSWLRLSQTAVLSKAISLPGITVRAGKVTELSGSSAVVDGDSIQASGSVKVKQLP